MTTATQTHTPGPWAVERVDYAAHSAYRVFNDELGVVAEIKSTDSGDEELPNARLIAAAPDLLAACNGLVGLVQLIQRREPELQTNHRFIDALAAIAKAEGR